MNTLCGKNVHLLTVKAGGTCSCCWALKNVTTIPNLSNLSDGLAATLSSQIKLTKDSTCTQCCFLLIGLLKIWAYT
jgi:hypothetical protein